MFLLNLAIVPGVNHKQAAGSKELKLLLRVYNVQPLGASDYLEMSRLFDTIFIRHIPLLTINKKTQARRLITLVDALYDHKVTQPTTIQHLPGFFPPWQQRPVAAGEGGDPRRSSAGGHFHTRRRLRTRREPHPDGRSGAEKGKNSSAFYGGQPQRSDRIWWGGVDMDLWYNNTFIRNDLSLSWLKKWGLKSRVILTHY